MRYERKYESQKDSQNLQHPGIKSTGIGEIYRVKLLSDSDVM